MRIQSTISPIAPDIKRSLYSPPVPFKIQEKPVLTGGKPIEGLDPVLNENIKKALSLSFLVYNPLHHAEKELRAGGYDHIQTFSRWFTGAQFMCCTKDGHAYVIFRGSQSVLDWAIDFTCLPFFWPLRHFGFELAWRSARGKVVTWLKQTGDEHRKIVLCGHSLGGAMAHMAAFGLFEENHPIEHVITFGAPKAYFLGAAKKYDNLLKDITYTVVNQRDIVAKAPPAIIGYRNIGNLVYIDRNDGVHLGEEAEKTRDKESMADINLLFEIFQEEKAQALGQPILSYTNEKLSDWDKFYIEFRKAVSVLIQTQPALKMAIIPPVLYLVLSFYFMRSGLSHLTGKYINVFFKESGGVGFGEYRPSKLKIIVSWFIRVTLGGFLLCAFLYGLYSVTVWSIGLYSTPKTQS